MALNALNMTVEQQLAYSGMVSTPTATTVSNSTITLTATSNSAQFLSGTTAGQIFRLPSGTTIGAGAIYRFWNASSTSVVIQNNSGTVLTSISAGNQLDITLRTSGTTAGVWVWALSQSGGSSTVGVSPPIFFGRTGNCNAGTYLLTQGLALSNNTGALVPGYNYIAKVAVSSQSTITGSTAVVQLQARTAVSTLSDISGATVSVTAGNYSAISSPLTAVGPDTEFACYVTAGVIQSPIVLVYLTPQ